MRFSILLGTCLVGLVQSDATSVQNNLDAIGQLTTTLDNDVKLVIQGLLGVSGALQVQVDAVAVHNKLKQTINDANASPAFGEPGSQQVYAKLQSLLNTTKTTLQDTSAKNTTFDELGPIVRATLYQLRQDSLDLGVACIGKLSSTEVANAPALANELITAFNSAIVAYGGKT